jgi:hypothetical protein
MQNSRLTMKLVLPLAAFAYIASGVGCLAAALTETSLAPAWVAASQAEKDAWIGAFKFAKSAADRPGIAKCLDKMAALPPFATNKLTGVTSMCETAVERSGM